MMMEGDLTLDGKHIMQYTDNVLKNCILEIYIILLSNVIPINLRKKILKNEKKSLVQCPAPH